MIKTPIINFGNCFRKVKKRGDGKRPWHRAKAWGAISISPFGKGKESLTGSDRRTKTVLSLSNKVPSSAQKAELSSCTIKAVNSVQLSKHAS